VSGTRPLPAVPVRRYRAGRRRAAGALRGLARDFLIIFTAWALTAYPILWLAYRVVGPALFGGTTP
jgi:hypothetical protein